MALALHLDCRALSGFDFLRNCLAPEPDCCDEQAYCDEPRWWDEPAYCDERTWWDEPTWWGEATYGDDTCYPQPTYETPPCEEEDRGLFGGRWFQGGLCGGLFRGGWKPYLGGDYEEPCPLPPEGECNEPDVYGWEPHPLLNHPSLLNDRIWGREQPVGNPLTRAPGGPPEAPPQPLGPPALIPNPEVTDASVTTGGWSRRTFQAALELSPQRLVAPVGQSVVLRAGICGVDGYLITKQPIEWSLSSDSVGTIVEVDQMDKSVWRTFWGQTPKKLSGEYALGRTSTTAQLLPRGTIGVQDDIWLLRGQTWVSVTSASEGASHVTAVAPSVAGWNERRKTATVHWVDGQWGFPPPSISSYGGGQTLVTRVTRATTNAPIENWIVRYELAGGTPAALDANGAQALEVRTNNNGEAAVTVIPQGDFTGVTNINIQVIRTGSTPGDLARLPVGQGSTTVTWVDSAAPSTPLPPATGTPVPQPAPGPTVTIQMNGPASAEVGALVTYRIRLDNLGLQPVPSIDVTSNVPSEFEYQSSLPPAENMGGQLRWQMGPLDAGLPRQITVNYRVRRGGSVRVCASANVGGVLPAEDCVTTVIPSGPGVAEPAPGGPGLEPANLRVSVQGPSTATVGGRVDYQLLISNPANRTVVVTELTTSFADGLEHSAGLSPIRTQAFGSLGPGQSRAWPLSFVVRSAGQQCFEVTVADDGGGRGTARFCVTSTVAAPTPPPSPPSGSGPPPSGSGLLVQKTGPSASRLGDQFEFTIVITNLSGTNLTNVKVVDEFDIALEPYGTLPEAQARDGNQLSWNLSYIPVGQSVSIRVGCRCIAPSSRSCNRVTATVGTLSSSDEVCLRIDEASFGSPSPIQPDIELRGQERPDTFSPSGPQTTPGFNPSDPTAPLDLSSGLDVRVRTGIEDGSELREYFVEITNTSSSDQTNVILTTQLAQGASFVRSTDPPGIARSTPDGRELEFNPIRSLRSNERVSVQLVLNTGGRAQLPLRAHVTSDSTSAPVLASGR